MNPTPKTKLAPIPVTLSASLTLVSEPPALPSPWSVNDVLRLIPEQWRDARCLVSNLSGTYFEIQRVIFEVNHSGRKCIILSPVETKVERP